jgi:hypothetical protein
MKRNSMAGEICETRNCGERDMQCWRARSASAASSATAADSAVFSGIVSGGVMMPGLFKTKVEGPDFVTGGSFGMEESLGALTFCTGAGIVMLLIAMRRGHMLPPPWKRKG